MNLHIMQFSLSCLYFLPFRTNYLPHHPISNSINLSMHVPCILYSLLFRPANAQRIYYQLIFIS